MSKNQINLYKYGEDEITKLVYKCNDSKVMEELSKLYNSMNYAEELLMRK